jgi:hypothetical protein
VSENTAGTWDDDMHFTPGIAVTHTRTKYVDPIGLTNGPDYCEECTIAWQNWVRWPCDES